jgi:phosphatidylglycerophosphatase A
MPRSAGDRVAIGLATVLGAGRSPVAPGTVGTAAAIPLAYAAAPLGTVAYLAVCVAVTLVAIWAADRTDRALATHDSGSIVIDEVAGYLFTMAWVDRTEPLLLLAGFVVFRVADVVKPPPARIFDRGFHGGVGVVLDDVVAGLYGSLIVAGMALTDLHGHLAAMVR